MGYILFCVPSKQLRMEAQIFGLETRVYFLFDSSVFFLVFGFKLDTVILGAKISCHSINVPIYGLHNSKLFDKNLGFAYAFV